MFTILRTLDAKKLALYLALDMILCDSDLYLRKKCIWLRPVGLAIGWSRVTLNALNEYFDC